jgi:hypothetical protein
MAVFFFLRWKVIKPALGAHPKEKRDLPPKIFIQSTGITITCYPKCFEHLKHVVPRIGLDVFRQYVVFIKAR